MKKNQITEVKKWFHVLAKDEYKELRSDANTMKEIMQEFPQAFIYADDSLMDNDELLDLVDQVWVLESLKNPSEKILDKILTLKMLEG